MSSIKVKQQGVKSVLDMYGTYQQELSSAIGSVRNVKSNQCMTGSQFRSIYSSLDRVITRLENEKEDIRNLESGLSDIFNAYEMCENQISGQIKIGTIIEATLKKKSNIDDQYTKTDSEKVESSAEKSNWEKFVEEFLSEFGWRELLKGSNYIGTIYNLISDIRKGATWTDLAKSGVNIYKFMKEAAKTYSNYKKIGNAVGTNKAMAWWAKNITGLKPLGRASSAKNPFTRFANNLTNKTSPFNAQFKNVINNFKGTNGIGKAVTSWGSVAITGVTNWFSNKEEQINSNGTMSDGRVIAETVSETIIDTALIYGTGIVVGAAVTTVLGTVAAPGIVVVAISGGVVAGLNAGVKTLTGKTTTEWISDTILDTGEAIGKAVGNAAKKVSSSIGNWFQKLSFA